MLIDSVFACDKCPSDDIHAQKSRWILVRWTFAKEPSVSLVISEMLQLLSNQHSLRAAGRYMKKSTRGTSCYVDIVIHTSEDATNRTPAWTADQIKSLDCPKDLAPRFKLVLFLCHAKPLSYCSIWLKADFTSALSILEGRNAVSHGAPLKDIRYRLLADKRCADWAISTMVTLGI